MKRTTHITHPHPGPPLEGEGGFTLVEIIVTMVIAAIVAAMLVSYFGTSITRSAEPIIRLGSALNIQKVMENITADYRANNDIAALKTSIGAEGTDQNNSYGQYNVVDNSYIKFAGYAEAALVVGDPEDLLKVTVKDNNTGETLTALFTLSTGT